MNRKIKTSILVVVVFSVGLVGGTFLSSLLYMRNALSPFYGHALMEIAIDAQQLSMGKADDVLKRKASAIPTLTLTYHNFYYKSMADGDSRIAPLWQVQKYYQVSGEDVPAELKPILDPLPPKP